MDRRPYAVLQSVKHRGTFYLPGSSVLLTEAEYKGMGAGLVGPLSDPEAREILLSGKRAIVTTAAADLKAATDAKARTETDKQKAVEALKGFDERIDLATEKVLRAQQAVKTAEQDLANLEAEIDADIASVSASGEAEEETEEPTETEPTEPAPEGEPPPPPKKLFARRRSTK